MSDRLKAALADHYRIERELGVGSMATVYLAEDVKHHRKVAVKVLRSDLAASLGADRFLREIEIAAQLQHPHILMLIDSGEIDGFLYYVMPFVDGESVRDKLSKGDQMPIGDVLDILCDLTEALAYAHERGVVHRDVKPDNILVSGNNAVVTDFGLAKAVSEATGPQNMTKAGIALGTPPYMAPEQATADPNTDHRADIYAVGCVAYELLAGRPPFIGPNAQTILAAHMTETPEHVTARRDGVPTALANIVMRCLEKKPQDRFQTTEELFVQLQALRSSSGALVVTAEHPVTSGAFTARRTLIATLGAVAVLTIALGAWFLAGLGSAAGGGDGEMRSLAVLPFADLSPNRDQEYLGDGIAETLISTLSRIDGLRVAARTSAFSFKGRNEDIRTIGEQLGVSAVLEGTVQRSGNRIRITAQLINTVDGFNVWSETYDRDMDDVFAVQDEVTQAVVRALQVELIGGAGTPVEVSSTENIDAYNAYLLGLYHWNERAGQAQAIATAATHFERAIDADSGYALAWSGLADTYVLFPQYIPGVLSVDEAEYRAERAAHRAIQLDSSLAAPHTTLGALYQTRRQYDDARREYEQAVALDPGYPTGHQWYGTFLMIVGETAEAVTQMRLAEQLDPLSRIISVWVALALDADGQWEAAGEQLQKALLLDPNTVRVQRDAWIHYLRRSDFDQAGFHFARFLELAGEPEATVEQWRERVTNPETRAAALRLVVDSVLPALVLSSAEVVPWAMVPIRAEVLALLGEKDRALDMLEWEFGGLGGAEPLPLMTYVLSPELRGDPRFTALLTRLGLRQ